MDDAEHTQRVVVRGYERTVPLKEYDVLCAWCSTATTVTRYPGRPPRFCSETCATDARRAHDRARKAAIAPAPRPREPGSRPRGRPRQYPRDGAPAEPAWLTPDLPLSPHDARTLTDTLRATVRATVLVLRRATHLPKQQTLAILHVLEQAVAHWRPALMRRAVLDEVVRSDGVPSADHMAATLDLVMQTLHDSPWLTDIAQVRAIIEREGRMRRVGDLAQLRDLATAITDGLSLAQAGSEQAWMTVVSIPVGRTSRSIWRETYGFNCTRINNVHSIGHSMLVGKREMCIHASERSRECGAPAHAWCSCGAYSTTPWDSIGNSRDSLSASSVHQCR